MGTGLRFSAIRRTAMAVLATAALLLGGQQPAWAEDPVPPSEGADQTSSTPAEPVDPATPTEQPTDPPAPDPADTSTPPAEPSNTEPQPPAAARQAPAQAEFAALAAADVSATLTHLDGIRPFNDDNAPGHDQGESNGIIRTLDIVTYRVNVGASGDQVTEPKITLTLPKGVEVMVDAAGVHQIPAYCRVTDDPDNTSGVTPPTPAPPDPLTLTNTTWEALPAQTITCIAPTVSADQVRIFDFQTRVRPEVPHGTVLDIATLTVDPKNVDSAGEVVDAPPVGPFEDASGTMTVSAASKWDLSINGATATENSAFVRQSTVQGCNQGFGHDGEWCWVGGYPITMSIPDEGRGGIPMAGGDFSFEINVDPATVWGQATGTEFTDAQKAALNAADPKLWGGFIWTKVNDPQEAPYTYMYGSAAVGVAPATHTQVNSVRDSGDIVTSQPGGTGTPVKLTVTDADTTGYTYPTDAGTPTGYKLRTDRGHVFSIRIFLEVPLTTMIANGGVFDPDPNVTGDEIVLDFDPAEEIRSFVNMEVNEEPVTRPPNGAGQAVYDTAGLQFLSIADAATGLTSSDNTFADAEGTANNYRRAQLNLVDYTPGTIFFTSAPNYPTASLPRVHSPYYPAWWGPTGPTGVGMGDGVAVPGQTVLSNAQFDGDSVNGTTVLACQSFDNTKMQIATGQVIQMSGVDQQNISSDRFLGTYSDGTTWISGTYRNFMSGVSGLDPKPVPDQTAISERIGEFRVEYGTGSPTDSTCTGAISWSTTPGPDTTHVRYFIQNKPGWNAVYQRQQISVPYTVLENAIGTHIPVHLNYVMLPGWQNSYDTMMGLPADSWLRSGYDPEINNNDKASRGDLGDRLTYVEASARVTKEVWNNNFASPAPGTYPPADQFIANYHWFPENRTWKYTTARPSAWTDNLLPGLTYAPAPTYAPGSTIYFRLTPTLAANPPSGEVGRVVVEDCLPVSLVLQDASPAPNYFGSSTPGWTPTLECAAGEQYLAWEYVGVSDASTLKPIEMRATILATAAEGIRINEALITSTLDDKVLPQSQIGAPVNTRMATRAIADPDLQAAEQARYDQHLAMVQFGIDAPAGIAMSKASMTRRILVDENGWVSSPEVHWQVVVRAQENPDEVSDLDVIDLLPVSGVNSSYFSNDGQGTGDFVSAAVSSATIDETTQAEVPISPSPVRILYTSYDTTTLSSSTDVVDFINPLGTIQNDGSVVWCDAPTGGNVVYPVGGDAALCPVSADEVTGLRFLRPGLFGPNESFTVDIVNTAEGALPPDAPNRAAGERMYNRVMGQGEGLTLPLTSAARTDITATPALNNGLVSGVVWQDLNDDGARDADEMPIPNATVTIQGVDVMGWEFQFTTTTDEQGRYAFTGLRMSDEQGYRIRFYPPEDSGMVPTVIGPDSVGNDTVVHLGPDNQFITELDSGFRLGAADLVLDKHAYLFDEDGDGLADVGETIRFDFTVTNVSGRTIWDLYIYDPLTEGLGTIECATTVLQPYQQTTCGPIDYVVLPVAASDGRITNTAYATGDDRDDDPNNNPGGTDTEIVPAQPATRTGVVINKTAELTTDAGDDGLADVGDVITYSFEVTNNGEVPLFDVVVTDPMLGGEVCRFAELAPMATVDCEPRTHTVVATDIANGIVRNTATVTGDDRDGDPTNNPSDTDTEQMPSRNDTPGVAALSIDKVAALNDLNGDGAAQARETITYTFKVTNVGSVPLSSVVVTDPLFGDILILCDAATITPGEHTICGPVEHIVTDLNVQDGSIMNTAFATADEGDGDPTNNPVARDDEVVAATPTPVPALQVDKMARVIDANDDGLANVGESVRYSFTVTNIGSTELTDMVLDDPLLGGPVPCAASTLAAGQTTICGPVEYPVTELPPGDAILNTATATADDGDGNPNNNPTSTDSEAVPTGPALSGLVLDKKAELVTDADGDGLADAGDVIRYLFVVTNPTAEPVVNLVIDDPMLADVSCPVTMLGAYQQVTCGPVDYVVGDLDALDGIVQNVATARGELTDGTPVGDTDAEEVPADGMAPPALTIDKTAELVDSNGDARVQLGEIIRYTISVRNLSSITLTNVVVDDPMLGGALSCPKTELAAGETMTCGPVEHRVLAGDLVGGAVTNLATVTGDDGDGDPNNNPIARDRERVPFGPTITVTKAVSTTSVVVGDPVTYTITVTNPTDITFGAANPAVVVDDLSGVLDDGELIGAPSADIGAVTMLGNVLVWSSTAFEPGAVATIRYEVRSDEDGDQQMTNIAFVVPPTAGGDLDPETGLPIDPATGQPVIPATPTNCQAPTCATTTSTVNLPFDPPPPDDGGFPPPPSDDRPDKPDRLPATGVGLPDGLAALLTLGLGGALLARRRNNS